MDRKQKKRIAKNRAQKSRSSENAGVRVRSRYRIVPVKHSEKGKAALGIAASMIVLYVIFLAAAALSQGTLSTYYGSVGVLALIISFVSLIMGTQSRKERKSFKLYPNLAIAASLLSCALWIGTYILGWINP